MSENTFGIIFRNVRFGGDRRGTAFLTVLAHQSFRVQVRTRRGKPTFVCYFGENYYMQQEEVSDMLPESLTKAL